ncbi:STAS domain-containing protein [Herpetosiphon gulosus]|uniref:STAS domain-containing protein n=1 Tax=Herpetosiphon gulosus TaxID=1973496 RepID=A0ABP9X3W3_9CHLR
MLPETLIQQMSHGWVHAPIASLIYHRSGRAELLNLAGMELLQYQPEEAALAQQHYNLHRDPSLQAPLTKSAIASAFEGKKTRIGELDYELLNVHARPSGKHIVARLNLAPLRVEAKTGEYIVAFFTDITPQVTMRRELDSRKHEIQQAEQQQEALRAEIEARSAPVVPVLPGILVLPLVGAIDSRRAEYVLNCLLEAASEHSADTLLLDVTGIPVVDTAVANYLLQAIKALKLLGTDTIVVGISPEIAQTLVQLGLRLEDITTRADLQSGLQTALRRQGQIILARS